MTRFEVLAMGLVRFIQRWGWIVFGIETAFLVIGLALGSWVLIWAYFALWFVEVVVGLPLAIWFSREMRKK